MWCLILSIPDLCHLSYFEIVFLTCELKYIFTVYASALISSMTYFTAIDCYRSWRERGIATAEKSFSFINNDAYMVIHRGVITVNTQDKCVRIKISSIYY